MPQKKRCDSCYRKVRVPAGVRDTEFACPICGGEFRKVSLVPEPTRPSTPEGKFWIALMFRLCGELAGIRGLNHFWCDGFLPEQYHLDQPSPCITGKVWLYGKWHGGWWEFTLFLKHPVSLHSEIYWRSMLPPDDVTRWIAVDLASKRLEIEPSAAVPDLA
jgi:hypothetical protein